MQEPLQGGEVWLAWDHVARMIEALRGNPDGFVAFPAPVGPKGLGLFPTTAPQGGDWQGLGAGRLVELGPGRHPR
jgi:hypothetical protein